MILSILAMTLLGQGNFMADASELKAAFNKDKGRVRIVMLLSPT
jgi:hypothetical protein